MDDLTSIYTRGGWVTYGLTLVSILLWAGVWARIRALRPTVVTRFVAEARLLGESDSRQERFLERTVVSLSAWQNPIRVLVLVAPLLGLLGTVSGMVEMFDSLHGSSAVVREGSVAGGISTALITTQLGLIIGVPGLVAARLLDRRQLRMERELRIELRSMQSRARRAESAEKRSADRLRILQSEGVL